MEQETATDGKTLLTTGQAAVRLGVHRTTMGRWVRAGKLPAVRIGRRYRLRLADVDTMRKEVRHDL
jgi:excisionase family DNA binding protein